MHSESINKQLFIAGESKVNIFRTAILLTGIIITMSAPVIAEQQDSEVLLDGKELYKLQTKTERLIKLLVEEGILDKDQARELIKRAEQEAVDKFGAVTEVVPESDKDAPEKQEPGVVRVPYIPKHIRDQIRDEVRIGLKEDVSKDVLGQAKNERWGVPGAWPAWIKRISWSGDIRFRGQLEGFSEDNSTQYLDINAINDAGGTILAGTDAFLNTTEDRSRMRLRARLGLKAKITEGWTAVTRLVTGSSNNPVSANVTLGDSFTSSDISLDRAYIKHQTAPKNWELWLGRMPNPWFSTDLVWDDDLNFEGIAASYWPRRSNDLFDSDIQFDPFITLGVLPLEEIELSSKDKWLFGLQLGFHYTWLNQNRLRMGLAYYDYRNIEGRLNNFGSELLDFTAPDFVQKGNTLFDIRNDADPNTELAALASDYNLIDLTLAYDIANFVPTQIIIEANIVKNVGYDRDEIFQRTGALIEEKTDGYQLKVTVGWPKIKKRYDWQVSLAYKELERDAVLDAFTDSDFHLGGTDGEGYILTGQYGLAENTWLRMRLLSSNEIDGPPLGVDIWQVDLNVKF